MESLGLEEENVIEDIANLFGLKKEQNYTWIKAIWNFYQQDKILRDIKNFFEHKKEEENYYKPFNNYIEYKSNSHKHKKLSVEEYLDKISLYLKEIINSLKKSDTWKINNSK